MTVAFSTRYFGFYGQVPNGLIADLPKGAMLLADKRYDANTLRDAVRARCAWPNIPPTSNRRGSVCFSKHLFRARNLVEKVFNKIKNYRLIAIRYDKLAENDMAPLQLVAIRISIKDL